MIDLKLTSNEIQLTQEVMVLQRLRYKVQHMVVSCREHATAWPLLVLACVAGDRLDADQECLQHSLLLM